MKINGPLTTLGAVAVLGVGILFVNISQEPETSAPGRPVAESPAATAAPRPQAPVAPTTPPQAVFPRQADYVGKVPIVGGDITLEITVDGKEAVAYACDGDTVEVWFAGNAENGVVNLSNKDKTSRLQGRLQDNTLVGTLWIQQKEWDFTTAAVQPPAGLYVYEEDGNRSSWIVDANETVTGVQRQPDGSTSAAPNLSPDGTAVINGRTVAASRVEGDSDVV